MVSKTQTHVSYIMSLSAFCAPRVLYHKGRTSPSCNIYIEMVLNLAPSEEERLSPSKNPHRKMGMQSQAEPCKPTQPEVNSTHTNTSITNNLILFLSLLSQCGFILQLPPEHRSIMHPQSHSAAELALFPFQRMSHNYA